MAISLRIPQVFRTHKKKTIAAIVVIVLLGIGISRATAPKQPQYITAVAEKSDLQQTVEAVGTVVSERELELRFAGAGIVSDVFVREGDHVQAGQRLAQLKGGSLAADVASQAAALTSAQADLQALLEGSRPEDIAIAQADLQSKEASLQVAQQTLASAEDNIRTGQQQLDALKQEANVNLAGQVSTSLSGLGGNLTAAENSLSTIDDVLSRTDVNDAIVKTNSNAGNDVRTQQQAAIAAIDAARAKSATVGTDYQAAIDALNAAKSGTDASSTAMDTLFSLISSLQETQYFSSSVRETIKASIASERSKIETAGSAIATSLSALQNASATYDTKIVSQQATLTTLQGTRDKAKTDILTYQSAVQASQAQLDLKKSPSRSTDVDSARARVQEAQANLARASSNYSDTILTAPVSGTVTHVNIRIGEAPPASDAAVTLLGESPYRVEMFVSEIDIPKVQLTQSGSIELDAFRGTHMALRVGDIDPSSTDKEGVPKYRVRLDFVYPHNDLKIGMTGDAAITTGMRSNVVHIPQRAVLQDDQGKSYVRVLKKDGSLEQRPVETGMEGATGDVEITQGLKEGETVVVLVKT